MIDLIMDAMKMTIKEADWMSDETKQQALEKVSILYHSKYTLWLYKFGFCNETCICCKSVKF